MARTGSYRWLGGVAFAALGGGFGVAGYAVVQPVPRPAFAPVEAVAAVSDDRVLAYQALDGQVAVAVAEQPVRVMLDLGFAVRGSVADLIALQAAVEAGKPALMAALLAAAQVEVAKSADPAVLLVSLPGPLREAVNRALATEALPEPVEEVLITGLVTQ